MLNSRDKDSKSIVQMSKLFSEFVTLFQSNFDFMTQQSQILNSSYYSLPLMFNVINTLKANKVGHIPSLDEVKKKVIYEKFHDLLPEVSDKSFTELVSCLKDSIQSDNESRTDLEKMEKYLDHIFAIHKKWAKTVDIEKIPPTRQVELDDAKEEELNHRMLEITSKIFEKSRVILNRLMNFGLNLHFSRLGIDTVT
jgi:hypothetical protein